MGRGAEWFRYFATAPRKNNECFTVPQTQAARYAKWFDEVNALASNIDLVLSGHVHLYQMLDFLDSPRPPQVTVGSSGTTLDMPPDDTEVTGRTVDGETVRHSVSRGVHGYALLSDTAGQWNLTFHGVSGQAWPLDCLLSTGGPTKEFTCK